MTAGPAPLLNTPSARRRLRQTLRAYTNHLIATPRNARAAPVSPAAEVEVVLNLLHKCQALDEGASFVRLLQHFGVLLGRSGPLDQLDQHLAAALARDDLSPDQRVQLASLSIRLLIDLGNRERAQAVLAATWPVAEGFPHLQVELYFRQGLLAATFGDYTAGREAYEAGLTLALANRDSERSSILYHNLGNMLYALDEYAEALAYYARALEVGQELPDPIHRARAENGLAMTLDELGRYREAAQHYDTARRWAEQAGDLFILVSVDLNLSYHAILQGRYVEVKRPASRALALARRLGDLHRQATASHNLGRACLGLGEYEDAWAHLSQALEKRLLLRKPLFIQTTAAVIAELAHVLRTDTTLAPTTRERLRQACQEALETAQSALSPG
ncbi:MAG TPA: hypothetical protein DEP84_01540 [Chloroflexi bacterium]|nr:hypothetical protein [Chloroflexota bacterium]